MFLQSSGDVSAKADGVHIVVTQIYIISYTLFEFKRTSQIVHTTSFIRILYSSPKDILYLPHPPHKKFSFPFHTYPFPHSPSSTTYPKNPPSPTPPILIRKHQQYALLGAGIDVL